MNCYPGGSLEILDFFRDVRKKTVGGPEHGIVTVFRYLNRGVLGRLDRLEGGDSVRRATQTTACVFGLVEPSLSELLSGDVRVPSPHVESSHLLVDGLGDPLLPPQPRE